MKSLLLFFELLHLSFRCLAVVLDSIQLCLRFVHARLGVHRCLNGRFAVLFQLLI